MKELNNQTVLLTGAGGGFGRQFMSQLGKKGCRFILADINKAIIEDAVKETGLSADRVVGILEADLSTEKGVDALFEQASALSSRIDILINNAGVAHRGNFDEVPRKKWMDLMQINTMAVMQLSALVMPAMKRARHGHIVNISSIAGHAPVAGLAAYNSSKFAVRGFSLAIAQELEEYNVNVTAVYPFFARTPILDSEQIGAQRDLPDFLVDDPADVIAEVVNAIEKNRLEVFPSLYARSVAGMARLAPGISRMFSRVLR